MELSIEGGAADIPAEDWDRLCHAPSPFLEHAFLLALEESGSVGPGTGWQPLFLTLRDEGELVGAVPAYVKSHSYGEYIFDWAWAQGSERAGLRYYPKLVVGVPFTPATGPRILLAPGQGREAALVLAGGLREVAETAGLSSVHVLFCSRQEREWLAEAGFLPRLTMQYHWENLGEWGSFPEFLHALKGKRRREIRRERRMVRDAGVEVRMLRGDELTDAHWAAMHRFYRDTTGRKWGQAYLSPAFFEQIRARFAHRVRFAGAFRDGALIAGALNFRRGDAMFGRYWGCDEPLPGLHFETCYYAAVEYCLQEGIPRYEAGAQGGHKVPRGFLPTPIYSAHWLRNADLSQAVERFLQHERREAEQALLAIARHSPFAD